MTSTFSTNDLEVIRNRTFDEIAVGDRASIERTLTAADIQLFAAMSGDINPTHIDAGVRRVDAFPRRRRARHVGRRADLGRARHAAARPGHGLRRPDAEFHAPVRVGDTLTIAVTVTARDEAKHRLVLDCTLRQPGRPDGDLRRGDRDRADRAHRAPARHAAAGAHRARARRRPRAAAAVRAAARAAQDGRRPSVRRA